MMNFYRTLGILLILPVVFYIGIVPFNPLHDFNHWMLDRHYRTAGLPHPQDSKLLAYKSYFGGPDDHGSHTCVYAAGEYRSSSLGKADLKLRYATSSVLSVYAFKKIPIQILFPDDPGSWSLNHPLGDWWPEFYEQAKSGTTTIYFLYVAETFPFWGDRRCDD